jgi:hypothetical protein
LSAAGASYPATMIPLLDPGELFGDMAQQFLGDITMPDSDPWGGYLPVDGTMQGFTTNYVSQVGSANEDNNIGDVMNYSPPNSCR